MFYVTAIIEMTHPENNFDETFQGLKQLEKNTNTEKGCHYFHIHPLNPHQFMLWEIWEDEEALDNHYLEAHTKEFLDKNLTQVASIWKTSVE